MFQVIQTLAIVSAVGTLACGATSPDPDPVYVPQSTTGVTQTGPTQVASGEYGVIPVGQQLDVRLQETLSSETAVPEQRFEATTVADVVQNGNVLIPAGSVVRGVVTDVDEADRLDRTGSLTLSFDQITIRGREYPLRGMATQVFESRGIRDEVGTVGAGAGVGGIVGGIIGGIEGALLGAAIGAGGVVAATEGEDVTLPAGSIIRIRLDSPLRVA